MLRGHVPNRYFPTMQCDAVVDLYKALAQAGIEIWIDGGWAVDALVGHQTRTHDDLDIAVEAKSVLGLRKVLADREYIEPPSCDSSRWNFVLADPGGRRIDVHVVELDDRLGVFGEPLDGIAYPAAALTGTGRLGNLPVKCVRADILLQFKTSYPPRPIDRLDVAALCALLGRPVPDTHLPASTIGRP
jgi:lincosamide nucleotidyltransferase A/C/D/E